MVNRGQLFFASIIAAVAFLGKGLGDQVLFHESAAWIWHLFAFYWFCVALAAVLSGLRS